MTSAAAPVDVFDPDVDWRLHPSVAVRPEPFGALLYHFGTRKLSFLKDRRVVDVVRSLDDHATARDACSAHGVDLGDPAVGRLWLHALGTLAASRMIIRGDRVA